MRLAILLTFSVLVIGRAFAVPPEATPKAEFAVDILRDTPGVNFGPYLLEEVMSKVREHWLSLIPESAQTKKGRLAIEFSVTKDGHVADMRIVASSGDEALDRPAWDSIKNSDPFPALPKDYKGQSLALRFRFYYNTKPD